MKIFTSAIKSSIKGIFNIIGLEIRNRKRHGLERRVALVEVLGHIIDVGFSPTTVIDVGVANGTYELYENFPHAKHLLVEPLVEFEPDLKSITEKYNAEYVIAAAGAKAGKITIHVHKDLLGSSVLNEAEGNHVDGVSRIVPVVTLDSLCKKQSGPYFIKIDVQGAELTVLDGATKILQDTEVIILEVHFFQIFVGGAQFFDVISYMKKRGYVVYDIFGGYNRPLDYALASVDMVFVKEHGMFRKSHFFASSEQRNRM